MGILALMGILAWREDSGLQREWPEFKHCYRQLLSFFFLLINYSWGHIFCNKCRPRVNVEPKLDVDVFWSCYNMENWHIAYCMQDVHNILLYCNTDVVIIKPVTGRASMCSASLKTTRRLIALGFHTEKVCQHSHSSDPVPVHTICTIYTATYRGLQGPCQQKHSCNSPLTN